jgi:hypothetical protein
MLALSRLPPPLLDLASAWFTDTARRHVLLSAHSMRFRRHSRWKIRR